ncbi:hypothetical protein [Kibdelosporangium aridum]|uniref:Aldo/keto reductase family protein n=1 Tax=Kibdelosporangium aridum TaxID=2030 RepID=A0A1W2FUP7_KIBAR|nr:hypothetical protein [Kibdelosporangium aridum]SMD25452.1 hypothetical protein SAMN05661093_09138 [Kibdelosporangium aridum]
MRYIKLGKTGLDVSPIAIGAMTNGEPERHQAAAPDAPRPQRQRLVPQVVTPGNP